RFGAMFAEVKDPFAVRSDDPRDWRIVAAADYRVEVRRAEDATLVLDRECLGRDEESHLFDELARFRGSGTVGRYTLSQSHMPELAAADLAIHRPRNPVRAARPGALFVPDGGMRCDPCCRAARPDDEFPRSRAPVRGRSSAN